MRLPSSLSVADSLAISHLMRPTPTVAISFLPVSESAATRPSTAALALTPKAISLLSPIARLASIRTALKQSAQPKAFYPRLRHCANFTKARRSL